MLLKDQLYMTVLANENSLTRAAAKLNISQPALSKWLSHLEAELGTPLVIRSRQGLIFTESGQIYLDGCRECMEVARNVRDELDALSHKSVQTIILGGSPIRGAQDFAKIFTDFREHYPGVELQFIGEKNFQLKELLLNGEITMSLLGSPSPGLPELEYLKFMDEELLLLLPPGHPRSYDPASLPLGKPYPVMDLSTLTGTPFLANLPETSYSEMVLELLRNAGLENNIIFRSNIVPLLYEMVLNGVGAALIPDAYYNPADGICAYSISPQITAHQGIGIRRGHPLSKAEEYLIHLLMNNWGSPYYMHQYADYYMAERKKRFYTYEYKQL